PIFKQTLFANNDQGLTLSEFESGIGPSDFTSFYVADIPVLSFFTGQHEDYHKPGDDAEKLNYEGMDKVSQFIYNIITDLNDNGDLAFRKTLKDGGVSVSAFFDQFKSQPQAGPYVDMLKEKITAAAKIGAAGNLDKLADNATPYLNAAALIAAGGVMEKKLDALAKCENASPAMKESAEFYMKNILPKAEYHLKTMDI
ncbi:MAG: M28 family peptidase, partial [Micavibrio sp.]|nr:M28 family peptidase [Micavibrio sp.]